MLNTVYQLVAPRKFEIVYQNISLQGQDAIVRPTHLSICNADQRYYQGLREAKVLQQKLPMALIHEAVGTVVCDPSGTFKPGEQVVMIPNIPVEEDEFIAENYLRSSRFRASGFDGFMQEYVTIQPDRLVRIPEGVDKTVAAFTEIVSVSVHALSRFDRIAHDRRRQVGIWGDGNLGYITALFFKYMFPDTKLYIFGINREKLSLSLMPYLRWNTFRMICIWIMHLSVLVVLVREKLLIRLLIEFSQKGRYLYWGYQSIQFLLIRV